VSSSSNQTPRGVADHLVAARVRFAADWRAGHNPSLEDVLAAAEPADRDGLFRVLLKIEVEHRTRAGESLGTSAFKKRFPDYAAAVMEVFRQLANNRGAVVGDTSVASESVPGSGGSSAVRRPAGIVVDRRPVLLGRFELVELLGEGAFGTVFRARDPHLDREVAVKVPRDALATPADKERFLREAKAAATIQHPNVCPIFEAGQDGDRLYIVMAMIAGKSLSAMLKERKEPMPQRQAAQIARKLALALDAAHQKGVIHRDLKPANIMFDRDRKDVVVMDFGLARRTTAGDVELTGSGLILGTPAYMAPEQARGDSRAVGPAADIYALGTILYEMLAGRRPFPGSVGEVIGQILHVEPDPPSKVRPGIDPRLESACLKAIAKDPAARFGSMREFAATLSECLKSLATAAAEETVGVRESIATDARPVSPGRFRRMPRRVWAAAGGLAGFLLVAGIIFFARTPTGRDPRFKVEEVKTPEPPADPKPPAIAKPQTDPAATWFQTTASAPAATPPKVADEFVQIFNGKDLTGWEKDEARNGASWDAEDGCLCCSGSGRAHLGTVRSDYRDVRVRVEAKITGNGLCGVNIRAPLDVSNPGGYRACIGTIARSQAQTGSLFLRPQAPVVKVMEVSVTAGEWFTMEFAVVGQHCTTKVNDRVVAEYEDGESLYNSGRITLDNVRAGILIRKFEVKELPPATVTAPADNPKPAEPVTPAKPIGKSNDPDREAAELVIDLGGSVAIEGHPDWYGTGGLPKANLPAERFRVTHIGVGNKPGVLREEHFILFAKLDGLKWLHLEGSPFAAAGLARIATCKTLEDLRLDGSNFDDADLAPFARHPALYSLDLAYNPVTDAVVDTLRTVKKLSSLRLTGVKTADAILEQLAGAGIPLATIDLSQSSVTDRGFQHLARFAALRVVVASETKITSAGLAALVKLPIQDLDLSHTAVSDAGVPYLKKLAKLQSINLSGTKLTDVGMDQFLRSGLSLTDLAIAIPTITDRGVFAIDHISTLQSLDITETKVTDASAARLARIPGLVSLRAEKTGLTNAAVPQLKKLTKLRSLNLTGTKIGGQPLQDLLKALPECQLEEP
jgi:hypothetical protein